MSEALRLATALMHGTAQAKMTASSGWPTDHTALGQLEVLGSVFQNAVRILSEQATPEVRFIHEDHKPGAMCISITGDLITVHRDGVCALDRVSGEKNSTDYLPHSRACGMSCTGHEPSGKTCAKDCPTCHGAGIR